MFGLRNSLEIKVVRAALSRKTIKCYEREYNKYTEWCKGRDIPAFPPSLKPVTDYLEPAIERKKLHHVENFWNMLLFVTKVRDLVLPKKWNTLIAGLKNRAVDHHKVPKLQEDLEHADFVKVVKKIWSIEDSIPKFRVICQILFRYITQLFMIYHSCHY